MVRSLTCLTWMVQIYISHESTVRGLWSVEKLTKTEAESGADALMSNQDDQNIVLMYVLYCSYYWHNVHSFGNHVFFTIEIKLNSRNIWNVKLKPKKFLICLIKLGFKFHLNSFASSSIVLEDLLLHNESVVCVNAPAPLPLSLVVSLYPLMPFFASFFLSTPKINHTCVKVHSYWSHSLSVCLGLIVLRRTNS